MLLWKKHFKTGSYAIHRNMKSLIHIYFLQTYICHNRQCKFIYINKTKYKPQATVQKSESGFQIYERQPTYTIYVVHLLYRKMDSFVHILNECNLTFLWHIKHLLVSTGKNKRNKEINKVEDVKFIKLK